MSDRFLVLDRTAPDYEDRLRAELDNRLAAARAAIKNGTYTTTLGASKAAKFAEVERVR